MDYNYLAYLELLAPRFIINTTTATITPRSPMVIADQEEEAAIDYLEAEYNFIVLPL